MAIRGGSSISAAMIYKQTAFEFNTVEGKDRRLSPTTLDQDGSTWPFLQSTSSKETGVAILNVDKANNSPHSDAVKLPIMAYHIHGSVGEWDDYFSPGIISNSGKCQLGRHFGSTDDHHHQFAII
ncbi:hypothetical protein MRB53_004283 [Persea americana]|uniref:Uncharacterized protein n=1 Tax=Persea americana TaxID=3435 RepID=A0ACC2MA58_PERAE|nr:hypothetical protein MRB53_004283 [Persea americana]